MQFSLAATFSALALTLVAAAPGFGSEPPPDPSGVDLAPLLQVFHSRDQRWVAPTLPPPGSHVEESLAITRGGAVLQSTFYSPPMPSNPQPTGARVTRAIATREQVTALRGIVRQSGLVAQPDCLQVNDALLFEWAYRGTTRYVWYGRDGVATLVVEHRDSAGGGTTLPLCPPALVDLERELKFWIGRAAQNPGTEVLHGSRP